MTAVVTPLAVDPDELTQSQVLPVRRDRSAQIERGRQRRVIRATTISMKRLTKRERELGALLYPPVDPAELPFARPVTRADCASVPRPCPFVSCRHSIYLDISPRTGGLKMNFPERAPEDMPGDASCVLDIADAGGSTLESVGAALGLTRERVRQIEMRALANIPEEGHAMLRQFAQEGSAGKRRLPVLQDDEDDTDDQGGDA